MTDAGQLDVDWLDAARANETERAVEDQLAAVVNEPVEIDENGSVWRTVSRQWMSQEAIDKACKTIDAGV